MNIIQGLLSKEYLLTNIIQGISFNECYPGNIFQEVFFQKILFNTVQTWCKLGSVRGR